MTSLILGRLIFEQSLEEKFLPTLFIFIAPPSIFVVDFFIITHGELGLMAYFLALFFVLLLLVLGNIFIFWLFGLILATFAVIFIAYKTILAIKSGDTFKE